MTYIEVCMLMDKPRTVSSLYDHKSLLRPVCAEDLAQTGLLLTNYIILVCPYRSWWSHTFLCLFSCFCNWLKWSDVSHRCLMIPFVFVYLVCVLPVFFVSASIPLLSLSMCFCLVPLSSFEYFWVWTFWLSACLPANWSYCICKSVCLH